MSLIDVYAQEHGFDLGSQEAIVQFFKRKDYWYLKNCIAENAETIGKLYERELGRLKEDWKENYVVYPFLPNKDMSNFM